MMASVSGWFVSHPIIETAPRRLWTTLIALLPACVGCSAVLRASPDGFCDECLERSRETFDDELGGES
jgi:hypothetical protein